MGIDLDEARASGVSPRKIARLLLAQPAGARVWREIGGWMALPEEVVVAQQEIHVQLLIQHANAGGKGKAPKPPEPPIGLIEERKRKKRREERHVTKAFEFLAVTDTPEMRAEIERRLASWGDLSKLQAGEQKNDFVRRRMEGWAH